MANEVLQHCQYIHHPLYNVIILVILRIDVVESGKHQSVLLLLP
jgi:hypothetical protein